MNVEIVNENDDDNEIIDKNDNTYSNNSKITYSVDSIDEADAILGDLNENDRENLRRSSRNFL